MKGAFLAVLGISLATLVAVPAHAGTVDIGGGWSASWPASLDGLVAITDHNVNSVVVVPNTGGQTGVIFQKTAEFTQGPVLGVFPTIPITFTQTAVNAAEWLIIDDEIITNSTGVDWTDFHMLLVDGGNAVFDPARTTGGDGPIGWTIDPFQQAQFTTPELLDIWDGVVPNGTQWNPGDGATDGLLFIDVTLGGEGNFTTFTLKETPTPEPASLALMLIGGAMVLRRRHTS